jgi:hypothetical protein
MNLGWLSSTIPLADGIVAYAYPDASTNLWNASLAFPNRNFGPPTNTGFTDSSRNFTAAATAASRDPRLLILHNQESSKNQKLFQHFSSFSFFFFFCFYFILFYFIGFLGEFLHVIIHGKM